VVCTVQMKVCFKKMEIPKMQVTESMSYTHTSISLPIHIVSITLKA
jgi:hypothetical protein